MIIMPAKRLRGALKLPGDKSISHRAAIIAALASGQSTLTNFSTSEDCASTLECLRRLGVSVERDQKGVVVSGAGRESLRRPLSGPLDCGNSGTTMRLLAGLLSAQSFTSELTGDTALRSRPMGRIIEPLQRMGARVFSENGYAPLRIDGRFPLSPIVYEMPVASAQVKSCVLLAGLGAEGRTTLVENVAPARDHTERMFSWFGVPLKTSLNDNAPGYLRTISVDGPVTFMGKSVSIPGDISSATFFLAAASFLPGSSLEIIAVGLNPTRTRIIETLREFGADMRINGRRNPCNEPVGNIRVTGNRVPPPASAVKCLRGAMIPELIDELPMLAVLGTQIEGGLKISDAAELRLKETDRIAATVSNLQAMGANVEEFDDGLYVKGPVRLKGAAIDARGDHRIAMSFAIAALFAEGPTEIVDPECARVSFPEFFSFLESIVER